MSLTQEQRDALVTRAGRAGGLVSEGINLLAQQNSAQTSQIVALQADLATLIGRVAATESRATAAESRLDGHDSDVSALFTAVTGQAEGIEATDADDNGVTDVSQSQSQSQSQY